MNCNKFKKNSLKFNIEIRFELEINKGGFELLFFLYAEQIYTILRCDKIF